MLPGASDEVQEQVQRNVIMMQRSARQMGHAGVQSEAGLRLDGTRFGNPVKSIPPNTEKMPTETLRRKRRQQHEQ